MKKLLYVTHSAGYRHEVLPHSQEVLRRLGEGSGAFAATATNNVADVDWDDLARYDAVAFCTTGELPMSDGDKEALIEFVRGGRGFIGIHNATDTLYGYAPYGEMIGGYFNGHPWHQEVGIIVEDHDHPATRDLPDHFRIHDEIYTHRNWSREKTRVLMRLDNSTVDLSRAAGNRADNDFAMAWCHPFGAGRVFYTALGHDRPAWDSDLFRKHLLGGIRWAMADAG
ncbi:MAG: ThuA domain-containing protein [Armatimonadetes bacterium]|nr:ThuA domain-containing protein [Armatimonadota bacterium]